MNSCDAFCLYAAFKNSSCWRIGAYLCADGMFAEWRVVAIEFVADAVTGC